MRIYKTWFKWSLYDPPGHCKSWGASVHHTPTFCPFEANWSLLRGGQLWVLRSTLTLKTTDTTLVSVDGNIGHRGALVPLPHASPDTITEETPTECHCHTLTIPWTFTRSRDSRDFGRDRAQDQVLAQEYATAALQY